MSRDHRKLRVFQLADVSVDVVYTETRGFPASERFGLQGQLRRAAVSVCANIVEGSARSSAPEYIHFLNVATGSAAEVRYLSEVAFRQGYLKKPQLQNLADRYNQILGGLQALVASLTRLEARGPKPQASPEPDA